MAMDVSSCPASAALPLPPPPPRALRARDRLRISIEIRSKIDDAAMDAAAAAAHTQAPDFAVLLAPKMPEQHRAPCCACLAVARSARAALL